MRVWWKPLLSLFLVPLIGLILFPFAKHITEQRIHTAFTKDASPEQIESLANIQFAEICSASDSAQIREVLKTAGVCRDFLIFDAGLAVSAILLILGVLHLGVCYWLYRRARTSREALISSFKQGWTWTIALTFIMIAGQSVLMLVEVFYVTVLAANRYFPQLLLVLAFAGVWALYHSIKTLFQATPLEFAEKSSQSVTEAEAPNLWRTIRETAARLQTQPPDAVLLGLSSAFYVTELSVVHATGKTSGRTLYLSVPLMQRMPEDEVLAVVGHELGHFKGEDTKLTLQFYPRHRKAGLTAGHLLNGGLACWPALQILEFFFRSIQPALSIFDRSREFEADRQGSEATSRQTMAQALVRVHYLGEAWSVAYNESLVRATPIEQVLPEVITELKTQSEFWQGLATTQLSHPLDSHPPLTSRLEALSYPMREDEMKAFAATSITKSAYEAWLGKSGPDLLREASLEHQSVVEEQTLQVQVVSADQSSAEGASLLQKHFPDRTWPFSPLAVYFSVGAFLLIAIIFFAAGCVMLASAIGKSDSNKIAMAALFATGSGFAYVAYRVWRDHRGSLLKLTAVSVHHSSWRAPILFSEIIGIQELSQNGTITLIFQFAAKRPTPLRFPLFFKNVKAVNLGLSMQKGKSSEIRDLIYQYYTRRISESSRSGVA